MNMLLLAVSLSLVPMPKSVAVLGGEADCSFEALQRSVSEFKRVSSIAPEGYKLEVFEDGVLVEASTETGAFYAGQTLRQLRTADGKTPRVRISDAPKFSWRGLHLDVARHFFDKAAVVRFLETMAQFKLNALHLHLTDDQGWRIPIPGYPQLTNAVRTVENRRNFRDLTVTGTYGPYSYTRDELKEIVRRAAELHIRIVPEVEIPGHSRTVLKACPEFACSVDPHKVDNAVCVGKDATLRFYEKVLDEVCDIFPDAVVHIGGDECNRSDWKRCPECHERMKREGLANVAALQAWVTAHFERYLSRKGRRLMGWDEIAEGGLPANAMVMSWRGASTGIVAARNGHDVVMTPNEFCYFDYNQCIEDDRIPYMIDWTVPLPWAKVYMFDPLKGLLPQSQCHILGAQGNSWSEKTCTESELQWKIWPRAVALAEVLWSYPKCRDLAEFSVRLERQRERLVSSGVNAAPVCLHSRATARGHLTRQGDRLDYRCGNMRAVLSIEDGKLILSCDGKKVRDFKEDGAFFELDVLEVEPGSFFVTARRRGSEIVAVIRFDGEKVLASDRWDGDE